jgi:hypothetical protein
VRDLPHQTDGGRHLDGRPRIPFCRAASDTDDRDHTPGHHHGRTGDGMTTCERRFCPEQATTEVDGDWLCDACVQEHEWFAANFPFALLFVSPPDTSAPTGGTPC